MIVQSDGEALHYDVTGPAGAPPLVTLHGLASSTQHWRFFTPYYQRNHRVVSWTYRGHGGHPAPRDLATATVEQFADDAFAIWRAAQLPPAIVVGLSFGVQVGLELWRRHPEMVRAFVLICGTAGQPFGHVTTAQAPRRAIANAVRGLARAPFVAKPALAFLRSAAGRRIASELAYASGGAMRATCPRDVLDELFGHVGALSPGLVGQLAASYLEHDAFDVLPSITVPTLLVAADRDQLTPVATAERMHVAIPGSELVVFRGHSHLVQVEDPDGIHRAIDGFLQRRIG